ncbi:MAG: hypothetical protein EBX60_09560 [Betaproteobacteria bacterium]|nr:hypothetical protein [Betaproteobacteria bacterium]
MRHRTQTVNLWRRFHAGRKEKASLWRSTSRRNTNPRDHSQEKTKRAPPPDQATPIEVVGETLRAMMPWIKNNKLVDKSRN